VESSIKTRPDGPIGARFVGDAGHYDIKMRVYVRSAMSKELPDQRQVENKISDLLLAMPRLDEGAEWDVSSTSLPDD
jgi:hypothetical protein